MALTIAGTAWIDGAAAGPVLKLTAPISFWGGVDGATGDIVQAGHPERGRNVAGTVLAVPGLIRSSSSSAVMLELLHRGRAPAALLLAKRDAILPLGVIVAGEMGWPTIPAVECADLNVVEDGVQGSSPSFAG